ncbi:DUF3231 family protein [Alicyclobacillus ferrooxydans]|uniref:DUF3231 family protein n=1 Tax=Alicyclobacillus ferrooxydans TaxID=471514 RepID=A0A0P9GUA9_9BACL|nr:DUF3231 family protein [Alicyclobacillus ferrooxydans]KPV44840.1 hypothetical protein AN477_05295 [Alicyclobacillus ferrooxydans]
MANILESVTNVISSLNDNKTKPPMHVGEVMGCWTYLATIGEGIVATKIGLNTTTDEELVHALNEMMKVCETQMKTVTELLEREGIPIPPLDETKPNAQQSDIPAGVKLTDSEIANAMSVKAAAEIIACATQATTAIRTDIAMMFTRMQAEHLTFLTNLKALMQRRDWLKIPPYYIAPGRPQT